ncbi:MAG: transglutaminase domain-containing protein, partial [Acidobacteriota bacterium]
MSHRLIPAAVALALLLGPPSVSAGERTLEAVERALASRRARSERLEADRPDSGPRLDSLLGRLAERDRTQRAEFEDLAARDLPPKARERLARTREAWSAGQGRLLRLLRALDAPSERAARVRRRVIEAVPDTDLEEALALVRRLRAASRTEPLSLGELTVRAPEVQAPALSVGPGTDMLSGDAPPIGSIPPELRQQAETLGGPVEIYEFVRNGVRPAFYHGAMKGPLQTLLEGSGNDADTASLLIALLRAKGLPARYVRGTVDIPAAAAVALTGTTSPERALRVFQRAGIPVEPLSGGGGIAALRAERVWAEAYLPFANYRGVLLDTFEKTWVPLDAAFKRLEPSAGLDVRGLGFEAEAVFDDYLAAPSSLTPREEVRRRVEALLAEKAPGTEYEETLLHRGIAPQSLGHLPSSLPYRVEARAEVGYHPPEPLVHTARLVVESSHGSLLDTTFPVSRLLGQRLTLSWVPLDEEDEAVVTEFGGFFQTPPYLVEVKPVLKLGGVVLASGFGGAGLGVKVDFRIELSTPGVSDTIANRIIAGNLTAIGLAAGAVTASEEGESEAARQLAGLAFHYLERWDASDEELAALMRVVAVRPTVSTCLVQSAVQVDYAGGDPLYPVRYDWTGLTIDADRRPSAPVGVEDDTAARDFLLLSGLEGSILEARLFEDDLGIASVSTARTLQLAPGQGVEVLDIAPGEAELILPGLPLDEGVKGEIREASASGYQVRVPAAAIAHQAWSGSGYLILDDATGESAWQLQGGHSGGSTVPAVVDIPAEIVDTLRRQSESPSPRPGGVAFVQKYETTNYQEGTVDTVLERPFRVLVTDEEGYPVPSAPVTFRVLAGGGHLVDPGTGRADTTEVTVLSCDGGEDVEPCASLEPGEAVVSLRLGTRTDVVPRYVCEEPFTCTCPESEDCDPNDVGYATQVGMNLVTAGSGNVTLGDPFTAFGFPERLTESSEPEIILGFLAPQMPFHYNPVNLTIANWLYLGFNDRHGNPISNIQLQVSFRPDPVLGPVAPGSSHYREATTTPGHVLNYEDYTRCTAIHPSVIWGQCPDEAETAVARSSASAAGFALIVGDSPWSYYYYDYGTTHVPDVLWIAPHTNGFTCPRPDPSACAGWDQPLTLVWQGPGGGSQDSRGNLMEAYAPGSRADLDLWADVVYEEAEVTRTVDGEGEEHFRVTGTNRWRRERLLDSEFELRPLTPGTGVSAAAAHIGEGRYAAEMNIAPVPSLNTAGITGTHYPPLIRYLGSYGGDVDPTTIDPLTLTVERVRDPDRAVVIEQDYSLWGAESRITAVEPTPVFLDGSGTVTRPSILHHDVQPPEYGSLLEPRRVELFVRSAADDTAVLAGTGADPGPFEIPAGLSLPDGEYYAQVQLKGVSTDESDLPTDLPSARYPLPICPLVDLETPEVQVHVVRDPLNERLCGNEGHLRFRLCRAARVTLNVAGRPFTGSIDEQAPAPLIDLLLEEGLHEVIIPVGLPELDALESAPFTVEARDEVDPLQIATARGIIENSVLNRSVLPVGRTFVKGVDLLDGHLVHQATDLQVPGRHLGLEMTRTYSSAGSSSEGPLGGGWSFGYASRLFEDGQCGLATVVTADGSSQVFQTSDFVDFTPQKGYHTRLDRESPNTYVFTDKAGNVHHFDRPSLDGALLLSRITEPHGDTLEFTWDGNQRLTQVAEVHPEVGEVRALTLQYQTVFGFDRIVRAEIPSLALAVEYEYDERGNLTEVTRSGENLPGAEGPATDPRVEQYLYLPPRPFDPTAPPEGGTGADPYDPRRDHQLGTIIDANGSRREFVYFSESDPSLPGEVDGQLPAHQGGLWFTSRWELVKEVVEYPAPAVAQRTALTYDGTDFASARWTTTVRDARGNDTVYLLNGNGSPLEIHEPLGRLTEMRWAEDDIFKTWERDALGRETEFEYDGRGNLIAERILTDEFGPVVTQYEYDGQYNKLTRKEDAEGRVTRYVISESTGDLLEMTDAVDNLTVYSYDEHGRLEQVTDPRQNVTLHTDHDSFGNARTVTDLLGNVTSREWDARGRLLRQADTLGREMTQAWDGLDRPVRMTRVAGGDSDDETTTTEYFPGGQVRLARNPNGAETTYTLDGLNRVSATETVFGGETLTTTTTYDPNGNKKTETDRRAVTRRSFYDALNRLERVDIAAGRPGEGPLGTIAEYTYDLVGNRLSETNVAGLTTRFEYDDLYRATDRILPEVHPTTGEAYRLTFEYDLVGNVTEETDANGNPTAYEYDGLDRRTRVTNALGQITDILYADPEGSSVNKSEENDRIRGL